MPEEDAPALLNFGANLSNANPKERLKSFVTDTEELLNFLISSGRDYRGRTLVSPDLQQDLRTAWDEVRPQFNSVRFAIDQLSSDKITTHGLSGVQANLKTGLCQKFYTRFVEIGGWKVFKKFLDAIDNFLGSILKSLGLENGIEELKHVLEQSVDDDYPE